jgi:hypothetical protein
MTSNPPPVARITFKDHGKLLTGLVFERVCGDILQIVVADDERIFGVHESGVRLAAIHQEDEEAPVDPIQTAAVGDI